MKKVMLMNFWVILMILNAWSEAEEEENYLTGISVFGEQKIAYLSFQGETISVQEGDKIGDWQVISINKDSVTFKSADGITTELKLKNNAPLATATETSKVAPPIATEASMASQPPVGYRTVQTPFGTFTIREDEPITQATSSVPSPLPPLSSTPTNLADKPVTPTSETKPIATSPPDSVSMTVETADAPTPSSETKPIATSPPDSVSMTVETADAPTSSSRVVKTPFGDFVIEEETQLSAQNPPPSVPSKE
jgi:hypothetical protein